MAIEGSNPSLQAGMGQFERVCDAFTDALLLVDSNSMILYANPSVQRLFGHTPADVIGRSLSMLQPERLRAGHLRGFERYLQTGVKRLDWRAAQTMGLHRSGHEFPIEITFSEVVSHGKRLFSASVRDTGERKAAEASLRSAVAQLETILESTEDALLVVSPDHRITRYNRRFIDMWNVPESWLNPVSDDQVLDFVLSQISDPASFLRTIELPNAMDPVGPSFDLVACKDGRVVERHSRAQLDGNQALGRVWSFRDITERVRAEGMRAALHQISEAAHSATDLAALFARIHEIISELLPAKNFYVALHDGDSDLVTFPYFRDEFDAPPEPHLLQGHQGLTDMVLRSGDPLLLLPDSWASLSQRQDRDVQLMGTDGVDWLGIPLKTRKGTIGVLAVQSYSGDKRYTENDKELLQFVSNQVAAAIERTQALQAVRASEERFRNLFDQSPIIIYLLSFPEGRFHEMNAAGLAAYGYSRENLVGRTSVELNAWVDPDIRQRYLETMSSEGSVRNLEARMRRSNGESFIVLVSGSLVTLDGRDYSLNLLQDISERKLAESALQESEEQFKSAFQYSAIGMALVGLHGDFLKVNASLCEMIGYPADQLLRRNLTDITHPEDSAIDHDAQLALLAGDSQSYSIEKRFFNRDGAIVLALMAVSLVRDKSGKPRHLICQIDDITERRRAEHWQQHYTKTLGLIMAETPTAEVLESLVLFSERQADGMLCSVLLLSHDGKHLLSGAGPSLPDFFNHALDGTLIGPEVGSCGAAVVTGKLYIVEDVMVHPNWVRWRELAALAGLRSCWSHPIVSSDHKVLGTFAVYRRQPATPDAVELELIRRSADLAAIAIERAQHHEERRLAKVVFEQSIEGIMVTDLEDCVLLVNEAFETLTGFSASEVVGRPAAIIDTSRSDPLAEAQRRESLQTSGRWKGEVWGRKRAGEIYPLAISVATVNDAGGAPSHFISIINDTSEQKIQAARIEQLAFYDGLTGLPNRALFLDRLEQTLAASRRHGGGGAILFLDLDRFKEINDSQGHAVGDMALTEVARRFQSAVRKEETLARLGGDEFVLIAENADHQSAVRIALRLQNSLSEPLQLLGQSYMVGASIGIAFYPTDGDTSQDLIKRTDIAMYRAKTGGGGYRFYQAEMGAELEKRLNLAKRLANAMEGGDLMLYYQPQFDLSSGKVIGAEALLRWKDSTLGWVSPAEFVPIAEERGMMGRLGDWVMAQACRQINAWAEVGLRLDGKLAINVSALQLEDPDFVGRLLEIVHDAGLTPGLFELELTESTMMGDPERAVELLELLNAAGFGLSVDDFGTGYSSLAYLKRFAVDQIKIDISFVRNMLTDANDHSIVTTIIAMARSLKLRTTAEGVEEAGQAAALQALGCDFAQGYHFGRPEPADVFLEKWLQPIVKV